MDALTFLGNGIFLTVGVVIGAALMYGFEIYLDWKEDRNEK